MFFVTTLYAIRISVHAYAICWWPHVFVSGPHDMSTHDLKYPRQYIASNGAKGSPYQSYNTMFV